MDNGQNQLRGFNQEVSQNRLAPNPFSRRPNFRSVGNRALSPNAENNGQIMPEAGPQIAREMPVMGQVEEISSTAPEMPAATILSFNPDAIKTDKKTGLSDEGVRAVENVTSELSNTGDANDFYEKVRRGLMPANVRSLGKEIGKAA